MNGVFKRIYQIVHNKESLSKPARAEATDLGIWTRTVWGHFSPMPVPHLGSDSILQGLSIWTVRLSS